MGFQKFTKPFDIVLQRLKKIIRKFEKIYLKIEKIYKILDNSANIWPY